MWTVVSAVHRVGIKWTWGSGFVGGHFSGEYEYMQMQIHILRSGIYFMKSLKDKTNFKIQVLPLSKHISSQL